MHLGYLGDDAGADDYDGVIYWNLKTQSNVAYRTSCARGCRECNDKVDLIVDLVGPSRHRTVQSQYQSRHRTIRRTTH